MASSETVDAGKSGAFTDATENSPVILNLGCGIRTSHSCVNLDWSWWLKIGRNPVLKNLAPLVLDRARMNTLKEIASRPIRMHDLRKGIPFPDNSVDAVYHSHVIEHIDRNAVATFLREIYRVLKPGGIQRIVAPDLEPLARRYLESVSAAHLVDWREHDLLVAAMIEQMVRRESAALQDMSPRRGKIDTLVRGDARKRGETHQWMYDRINLPGLIKEGGFKDVRVLDYRTSGIPGWQTIGLDFDSGHEYKPGSIYIECAK
jgi:SAM-dependent methyltransferase